MRSYKAYAVSPDGSETYWDTCFNKSDCINVINQIEKQGEGFVAVRYYHCLGGLALEKEIENY